MVFIEIRHQGLAKTVYKEGDSKHSRLHELYALLQPLSSTTVAWTWPWMSMSVFTDSLYMDVEIGSSVCHEVLLFCYFFQPLKNLESTVSSQAYENRQWAVFWSAGHSLVTLTPQQGGWKCRLWSRLPALLPKDAVCRWCIYVSRSKKSLLWSCFVLLSFYPFLLCQAS